MSEFDPQHVYPLKDRKEHVLSGPSCWCKPYTQRGENESVVVVHNSADGREFLEGEVMIDEVTIDEMLIALNEMRVLEGHSRGQYQRQIKAIAAILEQHRDAVDFVAQYDLDAMNLFAIRAFVERVLNKVDDAKLATELPWDEFLEKVLQAELAALEKETE